jgi:XK-related protein
MANEFLPICDNLFNVISLAAYFCDCVFDIVLGYALLERGRINFFVAVVLIIAGSLIVSQVRTVDGVIAVGSGTEVVNLSF